MAGNVWVLAEHWQGRISDVTYESLALGREVATALGVRLEALLLGHNVKDLAASLGAADNVLSVDHAALEVVTPGAYASALSQLARARQPRCLLVPLTNVTLGVGTLVAAELKSPVLNFCRDIQVVDGKLRARSVLYGGKMEATVDLAGAGIVFGLWPGARPPEKGRVEKMPPVEDAAVALDAPRTTFERYIEPEAGDVDITQQSVLVAVGRGIQSRDNLELAETLASTLGGAVCGSRPVIDQGWLPLSRQVGKSGLTVKPKLYIAAGISGAPEHVEGIKGSELILAINSDPRAPIFQVAHYGVVGDALELLPAIEERVRNARN